MWNGRIQNVWRSVRFFHIQWEPSIVRTCNYILFMRECQFLPSLQFCLKKQEKTRLSKKRWHVRQLPRHKAIKKTKRVFFNPSTGLALSPSKKTLAPRKPTVRLYSTVKKKKLDGYFKNITSGKPWTFFPHDATMINGVLVKILLFLPVRKIVATQIF